MQLPLDKILKNVLAPAFGLVLLSGSAFAADQWKDKGKQCDATVFKSPADAEVEDLSKCSKAWVAYRTDYKAVKGDYKDRVVLAMQLLYKNGDEADAERAKEILARLGVDELPKRGASSGAKTGKTKAPKRETFAPPEPTKAQITAAKASIKAGLAAHKKNDLPKALASYEKAVSQAPGFPDGHYNAACITALQKDEAKMAGFLMNLRDLAAAGNAEAGKQLKMTRTDPDFAEFKDESAEYKRITGYAKIKIINHLGENGEENVDNLVGSLEELGYKPDTKESEKKVAKYPIIYFAEHARTQAYITKKLIEHPKVEAKQLPKDKLCGEDGCYDVVVQWSDEVKNGEPKRHVADPEEAEKKLDALEKEQDKILAKPDEAIDELDEALGKPEEVQDKIEDTLERPGKAVEKVEKTMDKIKGVF